MKNSKLKERADIVNFIYQSELLNVNIDQNDAFENGNFSIKQIKKIDVISKNYIKLKSVIIKYLKKGWEWSRINPLEKAILIYGSFELTYLDKPLVINEMVRLAKIYIPDDTYKYINSILDKVGDYFANLKKA